jgi:membrane protein YdbS with pleckstrin-like domain
MAIISCPECKQSVSDRAATCPHCGVAMGERAAPATRVAAPASASVPISWPASSAAGPEEVVWQGEASARLLARQLPAMLSGVIVPPLAFWLLPQALHFVGGMRRELRVAIAEQRSVIQLVVIGAVVLFSLSRLARVALDYARLRATRYRLTNQRLTVESGLFSKRVDDIDLRSLQDVALEQSALERLLGVGRLVIVSSDHSRPHLELIGIRDPRDVRERVRACAYQASQRQIFTRAT